MLNFKDKNYFDVEIQLTFDRTSKRNTIWLGFYLLRTYHFNGFHNSKVISDLETVDMEWLPVERIIIDLEKGLD